MLTTTLTHFYFRIKISEDICTSDLVSSIDISFIFLRLSMRLVYGLYLPYRLYSHEKGPNPNQLKKKVEKN